VSAHAFFFVPPVFGFPSFADERAWWSLAALLLVALVVGTLTSRLRAHAAEAEARARRADALRSLSRALGRGTSRAALFAATAERVGAELGGRATLVLPEDDGTLVPLGEAKDRGLEPSEEIACARAAEGGASATTPDGRTIAAPLDTGRGTIGVLLFRRRSEGPPPSRDDVLLLEACARLVAEALERAALAEKAQRAEVEAGTERVRNALLSSVSHDFRTPLAVIVAAASHLASQGDSLDAPARADLARTVEQEAQRLDRLVNDLLAMTRLDARVLRARKDWQPLEDVVGAALGRMEGVLRGRRVEVSLPQDLPLVPLDPVLVEQVLVNLLENAAKHTPDGVPVEVTARTGDGGGVVLEVADRGAGLRAGEEEAVFERFRRGSGARGDGVGLGLAVCRGIAAVHDGRLWAENRPGGGVAFRLYLPLDGPAPVPPPAEEPAAEARA
jgi:two-component system sensor histidine kinase KdpD